MATVKISELPAGTASTGAVVPATNAAGTTTEKITLGAIAGLPHAHGNITSDGKVGTASGLPLITAAAGVVTAGAFGSSAGQFCQGNDARLADARVPTGHKASHATGASDALSPSDIGAASASHVHAVADITGFTAAASAAAPVQSVNGLTGAITLPDDTRWGAFMPPAPAAPTATAGNAQVALTWTAPTVLAQTPITDYVVQYSSNSGSTWTTFSDGTSTATSATVTGLTTGTAYTFRVAAVNGVGQGAWSAASNAVTPTTNTDALFSSVSLLSTFNGSNGATVFADLSNNAASYSSSGVVTSTSVVKYGTASAYFSTASSQLSLASTSVMPYGTEDFCIECWLYPTTNVGDNTLIGSTASKGLLITWWNGGGTLRVGEVGGFPYAVDIQRNITSFNTWWHLAVTRSGGSLRVFKDGVQQGATASIGSYSFGRGETRIGLVSGVGRYENPDIAQSFIGYIDDLRITRGQARYTSNFTPPSSQLAP